MLTIGQLARHVGCTTKAVRVYHQRGLLAEPDRDGSGYRRYDANAIIQLTRIVTLVRSGVPLATIPRWLDSEGSERQSLLEDLDQTLDRRITELVERRHRLRDLEAPERLCLTPLGVVLIERLAELGFSEPYRRTERDGWILAQALMPDLAERYLPIKLSLFDDPEYVTVTRRWDAALWWSADDPRLPGLAEDTIRLADRITLPGDMAEMDRLPQGILDIFDTHRGESPSWRAAYRLIAERAANRAGAVEAAG